MAALRLAPQLIRRCSLYCTPYVRLMPKRAYITPTTTIFHTTSVQQQGKKKTLLLGPGFNAHH